MTKYIECSPAYGVDYTTQKDVKAAWNSHKDFVIETFGPDMGRYINKGDAQEDEKYMLRYSRLEKVVIV